LFKDYCSNTEALRGYSRFEKQKRAPYLAPAAHTVQHFKAPKEFQEAKESTARRERF